MARTLDETALRARIRDLHGQIKELQAQLRQERDAFKAALVLRRYRRNAKPNEEDAARARPSLYPDEERDHRRGGRRLCRWRVPFDEGGHPLGHDVRRRARTAVGGGSART